MLAHPASWVHYWLQAIPLYPYYWLYYNSSWFHPQETHLNTSQPHLHQFFQRIHHLARTRRVPLQWRHFITRAWSTLGRSDGSDGSVLRQGVAPKQKNIWSREMPKIWGLKWIELGFTNMRISSKKELIRIVCEIYGLSWFSIASCIPGIRNTILTAKIVHCMIWSLDDSQRVVGTQQKMTVLDCFG